MPLAEKSVGMIGAELRFAQLQRLLEQRQCQAQLPNGPVGRPDCRLGSPLVE